MECRISLEIWRDRVFITSNTSNMMAPVFLAFLQRNVWTWLEVQRAPLMTQLEICIHERGLPPPPGAAAWNKRDSSAAHKTSHNASRLIHLASQIFRWWLACQVLLFTKSDTFLELACIISEQSRAINDWIQNSRVLNQSCAGKAWCVNAVAAWFGQWEFGEKSPIHSPLSVTTLFSRRLML